MNEEKQKEEVKKTIKEEPVGFFKKVWYSIVKIEKYPNMAAQGLGKAISYMAKIVAILAVVLCLGMVYQANGMVKEGIAYLQNEFPEFSYKDGILNVESEERIVISEEDSVTGRTIIDTKTEDEQVINGYINEVTEAGDGVIVLKDKVIVKSSAVAGTISYDYKQTFEPMGLTEFNKANVIEYASGSQIASLYVSIFLTIFVYAFLMYFLTTLSNAIILSLFGYITTLLARIKMRFVAIFNMSVYALTLSTILNMIYIGINIFVPFNMEYFQVMYIAVAAIYIVAAILILKTEFIKQQFELMKIAEAEEIVKKEMQEKENQERENKEKEERKKKDKEEENKKTGKENNKGEQKKDKKESKKEKNGDTNVGQEPEGSNA